MKKPLTQVTEWLETAIKNGRSTDNTPHQMISEPIEKAEWAVKALKRIDARDSQNQKKRKRPTATKRAAKHSR